METLKIEDKLKLIKFKHLWLIHDKYDKVIPYKNSIQIQNAVPNSTLITFEHIGHYRMLWNKEVIETVIKCIAE
jgi:pimeloyl-ACP methyl ester carboxylesterase